MATMEEIRDRILVEDDGSVVLLVLQGGRDEARFGEEIEVITVLYLAYTSSVFGEVITVLYLAELVVDCLLRRAMAVVLLLVAKWYQTLLYTSMGSIGVVPNIEKWYQRASIGVGYSVQN